MALNVLIFIKRLKFFDAVNYHFLEVQGGKARDYTNDTLHHDNCFLSISKLPFYHIVFIDLCTRNKESCLGPVFRPFTISDQYSFQKLLQVFRSWFEDVHILWI